MRATARSAPAVQYPLRRSKFLAGVLAALLGAGALALAAWLAQSAQTGAWHAAAAGALWTGAAAGACHYWWTQFSGVLRWDGQEWFLHSTYPASAAVSLEGSPTVHVDLQHHLWLAIVPRGRRTLWLWVERSYEPPLWIDLRRAVYSRATPGGQRTDDGAASLSRATRDL